MQFSNIVNNVVISRSAILMFQTVQFPAQDDD